MSLRRLPRWALLLVVVWIPIVRSGLANLYEPFDAAGWLLWFVACVAWVSLIRWGISKVGLGPHRRGQDHPVPEESAPGVPMSAD
jgi:hypothetical protein